MTKAGFIGTGNMGNPMARNLIAAGVDLSRAGQGREDDGRLLGDFLRRVRPRRAELDQVRDRLFAHVRDDQLDAGGDEVASHRVAHVSGADEASLSH